MYIILSTICCSIDIGRNFMRRFMSHEEFLKHIDYLSKNLGEFIKENNLKVDYIIPILRSGAVPAVYISNRLNIVKFAPYQVKHIKYKNEKETIEILFNPIKSLNIQKEDPTFLIVEGTHSTGASVELCIDEILKEFPKGKLLYVCISKIYGSKSFTDKVIYEKAASFYNVNMPKDECKKLNIYNCDVIYPWETLEGELTHPDDFEENIFF